MKKDLSGTTVGYGMLFYLYERWICEVSQVGLMDAWWGVWKCLERDKLLGSVLGEKVKRRVVMSVIKKWDGMRPRNEGFGEEYEREDVVRFMGETGFEVLDGKVQLDEGVLKKVVEGEVFFKIMARSEESRVFVDPYVDYFYHEYKEEYPDYWTVFKRMGTPERDIEGEFKKKEYQEAHRLVEKQVVAKIEAEEIRSALDGDRVAGNNYLKRVEKTKVSVINLDEVDGIRDQVFETKKKPKKKEEVIVMEKPKDDPNFDPKGAMED